MEGTVAIQHVGTSQWLRIEEHTGSAKLVAGTQVVADRFVLRVQRSGQEAARRAAAEADVAIVVVGNDPHLGGRETLDRSTLDLPECEQELVRIVREANPRTVLVIVSSYPYALGALAETPAIIWTSHGGQELGHGLADVLSGDAEPSGRLAQTWFARDEDLPDILDYDIIQSRSTYRYSRAEPLYALGHGLGYADVSYESIELDPLMPGQPTANLTVVLANQGDRRTSELVQAYATAPEHPYDFPRRLLVAYRRVEIPAGESITVQLSVPLDRLATFSTAKAGMQLEPCEYLLLVGSSAATLPLAAMLRVPAVLRTPEESAPVPGPRGLRSLGEWFRAEHFDESSNLELVPETLLAGTAVASTDPSVPGGAVYRHWEGNPGAAALVEVVASPPHLPALDLPGSHDLVGNAASGSTIRIQAAGPGDTWNTIGTGELTEGFVGELRISLSPKAAVETAPKPAGIRVLLEGPAVISRLQIL
jgi:beta-glucosidase